MSIQTTVKLVGGMIVLLSSVIWGYGRIRAERRKTDELSAFCALVGYIEENIAHFNRPLPEIYADCSDEFPHGCDFIDILRRDGMKKAVGCMSVSSDKECARDIFSFAEKIGDGYRDEQTELCRYTEDRLRAVLEKRKSSAHDREKLYRTIPLLLALSVILMFI